MRKYFVYLMVAVGASMLLWLIDQDHSDPDLPEGWTQSYQIGSPANRPIVGIWMVDGQPEAHIVVASGVTWFEYNSLHPEGPLAPLFHEPPIWWIDMPGRAR